MSVAIVHDYLNQLGGAERTVLEMSRAFPDAPIYTSLYRPDSTFPEFKRLDVRVSPLDRLPVDRRFRALLPLYPAAFRALSPMREDLVISSSSGWAHAVRVEEESAHLVYCYTPARWLYEPAAYFPNRAARIAALPLTSALQRWDRRAARRPDLYVSISEHVARRVRAAYGIDSRVVYPPVRTDRLRPAPRGERLLVISRLLPYKRVDLVIEAANRTGLPLDVVGTGPALDDLRRLAGPTVTLHGHVDETTLDGFLRECRAVLFPGSEDFGIVPVEANAAGKPVVAFASGGVLETQVEDVTAALFREPTAEAVADAIRRADALETSPDQLAKNAERFSAAAFAEGLRAAADEARELAAHRRGARPAPALEPA